MQDHGALEKHRSGGLSDTARQIAAITDEGLFEELATAVLREANPVYASVVHTGINAEGKPIKSPVDGIAFVPGADPPHAIFLHHTTYKRDKLKQKWLHDPSTVKPRKGSKPTAPAGDVLKTIEIFSKAKKRIPNLIGTLVLTTNDEPPEDLIREVHAAGHGAGLSIDPWSRSRLSHFLDTNPEGQWIRRNKLGIEQTRLSQELLRKLSRDSLRLNRPPSDPATWIERDLDRLLTQISGRDVVFVTAASGFGKSVACYKRLEAHLNAGGVGLVLSHRTISEALSLEHAIGTTLQQLHPTLVPGQGTEALVLSTGSRLLLIVEDINRSQEGPLLIEKLSAWGQVKEKDNSAEHSSWQLLCPVWPRLLARVGETYRKKVEELTIEATPLSAEEGAKAVLKRHPALSLLDAETITKALDHDPLLIALHEPFHSPDPTSVLTRFIGGKLKDLAASGATFTAGELAQCLYDLAAAMLVHKELNPKWLDIAKWPEISQTPLSMLRHVAVQGEIFLLGGEGLNEALVFRHDRVRERILIDAIARDLASAQIGENVLSDPYFAEAIGAALAEAPVGGNIINNIRRTNPLALFHALRMFKQPANELQRAIVAAMESWLSETATHLPANNQLRWAALEALAETESPLVLSIVSRFSDLHWAAFRARFRNGDLIGGIELCRSVEPGVRMRGHEELI